MTFQVKKLFQGYSCAHRQWRDPGHCSYLHGYDRSIEITFEGERDEKGWVINFGGFQPLRDIFAYQFDHTCLIAPDDPFRQTFETLHYDEVINMRVMDPTIEGMTLWVAEHTANWLYGEGLAPRVNVVEVECREHNRNAAIWRADAKLFKGQ